ncbi:tautomerase family protein [Nocardia sp. NPDC060249]|uniref:tautomerase family protein n=1 Tax=Nocardia sp. NPDC060249 TaxID=3347082 RepID=UPI0036547FC4
MPEQPAALIVTLQEPRMPFYQCVIPAGTVSDDVRAALAEAITDVHATVTGAPRQFVNVMFIESPPGTFYTAGKRHACAVIAGTIRAGRDRETRARLLTGLSEAWTSITGVDARDVLLGLNEVDATSTMEAGLIMPAPGEEAAWFDRHRDTLGEILAPE